MPITNGVFESQKTFLGEDIPVNIKQKEIKLVPRRGTPNLRGIKNRGGQKRADTACKLKVKKFHLE